MSFLNNIFIKEEEKEEHIDFSKYSDKELYDQFKSSNWDKLDTDQKKLDLLQEIENRDAYSTGRMAARVDSIDPNDISRAGGYSPRCNVISVRLEENQYEILDSLKHEGEHAVQYYTPVDKSNISLDDKQLMNLEDMNSINNESHYKHYDNLYDVMTTELDANSKAFYFTSSLQDEYKDDPKYLEYLSNRKDHFHNVSNKIDALRIDKQTALYQTATNPSNHLNEKQINDIKSIISKDTYIDSYEEKTKVIDEVLQSTEIDLEHNMIITSQERQSWNDIIDENPLYDEYDNPLDYDPSDYAEELSDDSYDFYDDGDVLGDDSSDSVDYDL